MGTLHVGHNRLRLNPFAFPSDTDFRFLLLIVSVLGASLFIYHALYWSVRPGAKQALRSGQNYQRCVDDANALFAADPFSPSYVDALSLCGRASPTVEHTEARWMITGCGLLLVLALGIYFTFPSRKIWREQLRLLAEPDAPGVQDYLQELWRMAGLSRAPVFLWHPLHSGAGAVAFGHVGRNYVALSGGLVAQFYSDKPAFRAIVLHELAHVRNADLSKTNFTVALWQAFLAAALLPFALSLLFQIRQGPGFVANLMFRVLTLGVLVYLMRNAVLRARERYADVRASVWDGVGGALRRVLSSLPEQIESPLRNVLRVHPSPVERRLSVDAPDSLFRMGFWDALAAGVATTIVASNVELLLYYLTGNTEFELIVPALILAPLAIAVVGLGAWRATFAALAQGKSQPALGRLGLGLGLGCIAGQILSLEGYIEASVYGSSKAVFGFYVTLSILLLAISFFLVDWISAGASTWMDAAVSSRSPRAFYSIGLIIASAVFALSLRDLFSLHSLGAGVSGLRGFLSLMSALGSYFVNVLALSPVTLAALTSLWAFPLAASFWRGKLASDGQRNWAFLEPSSQRLKLPSLSTLNLGLALRIAVFGGLLFWVLLLVLWAGWRLWLSPAARHTGQMIVAFAFLQVATAALAQAAVGLTVARRVVRPAGIHGLFAAFVAGCVIVAGMLVLIFVFGKLNREFAWSVFIQVVNVGALLTLLTLALSRLVRWISHSGRKTPSLNEGLRPAVS